MTNEQALAIIAAYGADVRRWPAAEAGDVLACMAADPVVAAAHAEAGALDALLADWAGTAVPLLPLDGAALVPAAVVVPARPLRRWLAGGALAAAGAAALVLMLPMPAAMPAGSKAAPLVAAATAGSDAEGFAQIFTPTVDEDELI